MCPKDTSIVCLSSSSSSSSSANVGDNAMMVLFRLLGPDCGHLSSCKLRLNNAECRLT